MPNDHGSGDQPDDALTLLEQEDRRLSELFEEFERTAGQSGVEARDAHGQAGKLLVRHLAIWESAREHVATALGEGTDGELAPIAERLCSGNEERRRLLDRVEQLNRGIEPINLNAGQDFDAAMEPLRRHVTGEIRWDLDEALPRLRAGLSQDARQDFPSAHYITRHAPTSPTAERRRWYEKSAFLARLRTVYDHLRDYPSVHRDAEAKSADASPGAGHHGV